MAVRYRALRPFLYRYDGGDFCSIAFSDNQVSTGALVSYDRHECFSSVPNIMSLQKHDSNLEERKQLSLTAIRDGRSKVQEEIAEFRAKLQLAKDTITQFKGEIGKVRTRQ